jgi:hypothetical protein
MHRHATLILVDRGNLGVETDQVIDLAAKRGGAPLGRSLSSKRWIDLFGQLEALDASAARRA